MPGAPIDAANMQQIKCLGDYIRKDLLHSQVKLTYKSSQANQKITVSMSHTNYIIGGFNGVESN